MKRRERRWQPRLVGLDVDCPVQQRWRDVTLQVVPVQLRDVCAMDVHEFEPARRGR